MTLSQLNHKYKSDFMVGLFRRSGDNTYFGPADQLMEEVTAYNTANEGKSVIVIHSMWEPDGADGKKRGFTKINIGVYGNNLAECKETLNTFAKPPTPVIQQQS
jgi:hypothetical protein